MITSDSEFKTHETSMHETLVSFVHTFHISLILNLELLERECVEEVPAGILRGRDRFAMEFYATGVA